MKTIFAFLIMTATSMAATLNVPSQYATVNQAVAAAQAGDTIVLAAGTYAEHVQMVRPGTSDGARITLDGQGVATISRFTNAGHDYITVKRLTISSVLTAYTSVVTLSGTADYNVLEDLIINPQSTAQVNGMTFTNSLTPTNDPSYCLVQRCLIRNVKAYTGINVGGVENVFQNNIVRDLIQADYLRLMGINNIVRDSQFLNNTPQSGLGNHPDFVQTFGNNGETSYGHIIERNLVNGVGGGQLMQLSASGQVNIRDWTFRNNIFANASLGGGGSMPGMKFYNNVFYRIGSGISCGIRPFRYRNGLSTSHPIYSSSVNITPSGSLVAQGDGGVEQYGGTYTVEPQVFDLTLGMPLEAGRPYQASVRGTGYILYNGVNYINGQIFTAVEGVTSWSKGATNPADLSSVYLYQYGTVVYKGTTYTRGQWFVTDPAVRTYTSSWPEVFGGRRSVIEYSNNSEIKGNVFLECGDGTATKGWYSFNLLLTGISADYNYVAGPGFTPKKVDSQSRPIGNPGGWDGFSWYEPNGINGGNPSFTDPSNLDFRLQPGSILIDQGVVISGVTSDFANTIRPLGTAPDIGAYEYDDGSPPPDPPPAVTPPAAPSALSATAGSSSTIILGWTDNANNEGYFELNRSLNGSTWTTTDQISANTTGHTVTGLNASTLYYFRLRAVNADGNSAYTATVSTTTQAPPVVNLPPTAPSNFQTTAIGANSITMAWDDNSADETGFQIDCSPDGTSWTTIATLGSNVESWTNSGLVPSTTYFYRVRAGNQYGNSAWSNDDATTTAATPPPRPAQAQSTRADLIGQ